MKGLEDLSWSDLDVSMSNKTGTTNSTQSLSNRFNPTLQLVVSDR